MARLLGTIPSNRAEKEVLNQLRQQLPHDWVVVSDVTWAFAGPDGVVSDGQADVVVLVPGSGMIIIEVKGSRKFWIDDDGLWYREGTSGEKVLVPKPPPAQAMGNMHQLAKLVAYKGKWKEFPGRYSWIVAYPNGVASHVPSMFDESTLVTRRHMHDLAGRLRHALEVRGSEARGAAFDGDVVKEVARILTSRPFMVERADTAVDVQEDASKIEQLTRQQFSALRGIFELSKVAVTGPAGSGKTLLAIWRLQALIESGKKAIYVCYNKDLAATLRKRTPGYDGSIVHVDKFFRSLSPAPMRGGIAGDLNKYFREELPGEIFDFAAGLPQVDRYDAVIVDEAQDFSEYQLLALNELTKSEDGQWVVFSDRKQDLFRPGSGDDLGAEVIFKLFDNCRNTTEVNGATNSYLKFSDPIKSMLGMPAGEPPKVEICKNANAMADKAWEIAKEWAGDRGLAVLSPFKLENSSMANSFRGHGLELTTDLDQLGKKGKVYFSTIRGFKGIEAPAIILVDADIPSDGEASAFRREDLYVACTRPTARLAILTQNPEAADWFQKGGASLA